MLGGTLRLQLGTETFLKFRDEEYRGRGVFGHGMADTHWGVEGSSLSLDLPKGMDARKELLA